MRGLSYGTRQIVRSLHKKGVPIDTIIVSGGAGQSELARQLLADAIGRVVATTTHRSLSFSGPLCWARWPRAAILISSARCRANRHGILVAEDGRAFTGYQHPAAPRRWAVGRLSGCLSSARSGGLYPGSPSRRDAHRDMGASVEDAIVEIEEAAERSGRIAGRSCGTKRPHSSRIARPCSNAGAQDNAPAFHEKAPAFW